MEDKFEATINTASDEQPKKDAKTIFSKLIQKEQYVGDLFSINYEEGKVLVNDFYREQVGGIPNLCFVNGKITNSVIGSNNIINVKQTKIKKVVQKYPDGCIGSDN